MVLQLCKKPPNVSYCIYILYSGISSSLLYPIVIWVQTGAKAPWNEIYLDINIDKHIELC